jgi:prevent-host-death family protein
MFSACYTLRKGSLTGTEFGAKLRAVNLTKGIEPITNLKSKSAELLRRAQKTGQPIVITQNGKPTAVLVDVESYQRQQQALFLLKILAQGDQDYRAGRSLDHDHAQRRFDATFRRLEKEHG